jgi:hypothetical protein
MGYHTDFAGQFDCYRAEGPELRGFLQTIYEEGPAAVGPLADWLLEHDDPRGPRVVRLAASKAPRMSRFWDLFALKPEHAAYLTAFSNTRRMKRSAWKAEKLPDPVRLAAGLWVGEEGGYFVGGRGDFGQEKDRSVLSYNRPPGGQPGLWCGWAPDTSRRAVVWNGSEKFYDYVEWLEYLLEHFLEGWDYVLNGQVRWRGEDPNDRGVIVISENAVRTVRDGAA